MECQICHYTVEDFILGAKIISFATRQVTTVGAELWIATWFLTSFLVCFCLVCNVLIDIDFQPIGISEVEKEGFLVFHSGTSLQDKKVLTSGGRVLSVVAVACDLETSVAMALHAVQRIQFEGAFHRTDIAKRGCDFLREQK